MPHPPPNSPHERRTADRSSWTLLAAERVRVLARQRQRLPESYTDLRRLEAQGDLRPEMVAVAVRRRVARRETLATVDRLYASLESIVHRYGAIGRDPDDCLGALRALEHNSMSPMSVMEALGYTQGNIGRQFTARLFFNTAKDEAEIRNHPSSGL